MTIKDCRFKLICNYCNKVVFYFNKSAKEGILIEANDCMLPNGENPKIGCRIECTYCNKATNLSLNLIKVNEKYEG